MVAILTVAEEMVTIQEAITVIEIVVTSMVDTVHHVMIEVFTPLRIIFSRAAPLVNQEQVAGMFWIETLSPVVHRLEEGT